MRIGAAWAEIDHGRLARCGSDTEAERLWADDLEAAALPDRSIDAAPHPVELPSAGAGALAVPARADADELLTIVAWLERNAASVRLEAVDGLLAEPLPAIPSFAPAGGGAARRRTDRVDVRPRSERRRPSHRYGSTSTR